MCVVSNIGDQWRDSFPNRWPNFVPNVTPNQTTWPKMDVTRDEFEALKREMEELKKLLLAAKRFDEATGQPNCEMDDKVKLITEIAKLVGVDVSEVFKK